MQLEVGRVDKAHGLHGEVIVTLLSNRPERLDTGSVLAHDGGEFTVETARPHQHRFIVKFRELSTREQAQEARSTMLYGEPIDDPDELWVHELIGQRVLDTQGAELGTIVSIEENPASDLLVLDNDGLVPLSFFVERLEDGALVVDPPVGLLDASEAVDARESSSSD